MKRQLAVLTAPKKIEIIEEELPRLQPDQVLYRVISGGLCHSEIPCYLGKGCTGPNKYPYTSFIPEISYPRGVGHEPVCMVEDVGSAVKKFAVGDIVTGHISRAFATHLITGTQGLVKIPDTNKEPLTIYLNTLKNASSPLNSNSIPNIKATNEIINDVKLIGSFFFFVVSFI